MSTKYFSIRKIFKDSNIICESCNFHYSKYVDFVFFTVSGNEFPNTISHKYHVFCESCFKSILKHKSIPYSLFSKIIKIYNIQKKIIFLSHF